MCETPVVLRFLSWWSFSARCERWSGRGRAVFLIKEIALLPLGDIFTEESVWLRSGMSKVKAVTCIFWLSFGASLVAGVAMDFVRDVRPILEEHCFDCHGVEKQKSGLRLDSTLGILRGGESGEPLFVKGSSGESHLVKRSHRKV